MSAHTKILYKPRTPAHRMITDLDRAHVRCPVDNLRLPIFGSWWFKHGYLQVRAIRADLVLITNVWVDPRYRGGGAGRRMFQAVFKQADRHGVRVRTWAQAFDVGGLSTSDLWQWYYRLGFRADPGGSWHATRHPR